jgi:hypothetical protein
VVSDKRHEAKLRARALLGDRLEAALKAVKVHRAVKAIERRTGWDCGCARRKATLNAWDARRRG